MGLKSVLFRPMVLNGPASSADASPGSAKPGAVSPAAEQEPADGTEALLAVAQELKASIQTLYVKYLSPDGTGVDYAGLRASPEFSAYVAATRKLAPVDINALQSLPHADKVSFFINVYNALTIHANAVHDQAYVAKRRASSATSPEPKAGPDHPSSSSSSSASSPPPSARSRARLMAAATYIIAGQPFSLSDIEHGVLRGNRAPPSILGTLLGPPFGAGGRDARRAVAVAGPDPRIHFALNCGAVSCPPVRVFHRDNLEWALDAATVGFLDDEANFRLVPAKRTVWLSRIFRWYMRDFADGGQPEPSDPRGGKKGKRKGLMAVLRWIVEHGGKDLENRKTLDKWLGDLERGEGKIKVKFLKYDWNRNEM